MDSDSEYVDVDSEYVDGTDTAAVERAMQGLARAAADAHHAAAKVIAHIRTNLAALASEVTSGDAYTAVWAVAVMALGRVDSYAARSRLRRGVVRWADDPTLDVQFPEELFTLGRAAKKADSEKAAALKAAVKSFRAALAMGARDAAVEVPLIVERFFASLATGGQTEAAAKADTSAMDAEKARAAAIKAAVAREKARRAAIRAAAKAA